MAKGLTGSMDNLPFEQGSLDLIRPEGAIYNIGFERGLNELCKYKKGYSVNVPKYVWLEQQVEPAETSIHAQYSYAQPHLHRAPDML